MAVSNSERRLGLATQLLRASEQQAVEWREGHMALYVHQDNAAAVQLYSRYGLDQVWSDPSWRNALGSRARFLMHKDLGPLLDERKAREEQEEAEAAQRVCVQHGQQGSEGEGEATTEAAVVGGGGGDAGQMARDGIVRGALRDASYFGSTRHVRRLFSDCYGSEETAVAAAAVRVAAAAVDGVSLPVCLAMNLVRFVHDVSGRDRPAGGGVVSASFLNAKPAVGGFGVEPRRGGVLRVLFTVASDAVADTVVRSRRNLRDVDPSAVVFDALSDREEAQHRALWPAFLAAKAAGKPAQFHRARLVVDGERLACGTALVVAPGVHAPSASRCLASVPPRRAPPPHGGNMRSVAVLAFGGLCVGATIHEMVYGGPAKPHAPPPHEDGTPHAAAGDGQQVRVTPDRDGSSSSSGGGQSTSGAAPGDRSHAPSDGHAPPPPPPPQSAPGSPFLPGGGSGQVVSVVGSDSGDVKPPWVVDEITGLIWHRRAVTKNRLTAYIDDMQRHMGKLAEQAQMMGPRGQEWFSARMSEMETQVDLQAQIILFGVDTPNARRSYLEKYGCTKWSDSALAAIKRHSPLIEIGAGHGHWQAALTAAGADCLSFDDNSALPMNGMPNPGKVAKGDESEVRKHRRRTLLLVYPGPDSMAANSLKAYKGRHLLYVGESKGGINADGVFFDALENEWDMVGVEEVEPFPEGYERLYIFRRKAAAKGWLW
ncbi:hypothetical protein FOA52_009083 [Chlamydomonas sp. UWO 241]|nr:hypothetical protein FOA52_009083 [Chlamydomonas sp. UWO 241]